jgi:hypothetical protein
MTLGEAQLAGASSATKAGQVSPPDREPQTGPKESAQGRLPHSNNSSTIEFLRSQNGRWGNPSAIWIQTTALAPKGE